MQYTLCLRLVSILLALTLTTMAISAGNSIITPPLKHSLATFEGYKKQNSTAFLSEKTPQGKAVHRFWSDNFKHQFITISEAEKNAIIANDKNWIYDGIAFYAYETPVDGTVPLYRFWSDLFSGHFYTISSSEKNMVQANPDWKYEGIAFYVFPDNANNNFVAIHRLWSDQNHFRGHFYTSFHKEAQVLANSGNYAYEGTVFYANGAPNMCKKVGLQIPPFETGWHSHPPPYNDYEKEIIKKGQLLKKKQSIVMVFGGWEEADGNMNTFGRNISSTGGGYKLGWLANQIHDAGATPMITWEPWNGEDGGITQEKYSLDSIINGNHDDYISQFAKDVKAWGKPILLRPMHEMNGDYYPWSCTINGDDPTKYVRAFRRLKNLFNLHGANNAKFVWSPNYASPPSVADQCKNFSNLYPGDEYADYIGVSAYNWGKDTSKGPGWVSLESLLEPFIDDMARLFPSKEIIVSEMGVVNEATVSEKSEWLKQTYDYLSTKGTVSAVVYFDNFAYHNSSAADFRVTTGFHWPQYPIDTAITNAYIQSTEDYCD